MTGKTYGKVGEALLKLVTLYENECGPDELIERPIWLQEAVQLVRMADGGAVEPEIDWVEARAMLED